MQHSTFRLVSSAIETQYTKRPTTPAACSPLTFRHTFDRLMNRNNIKNEIRGDPEDVNNG